MVIFLFGEDEFRSQRKLAEIKNKFLEKNPDAPSGLFDFLEKEGASEEIIMAASSGGLFSQKKLIIIKNILLVKKDAGFGKLEEFLKKKAKKEDDNLILLFWEGSRAKKSEKLFKLFKKIAKCQEFPSLEGVRLKNWVAAEIEKTSGGKISADPEAVEKLSMFVGSNLSLLSREIEKLVSFRDRGKISGGDVDLLVKSKIDSDIFKTIDALARGDKREAISLVHNHLEAGEDPFYLLSMFFFQFRNLLKAKPLAEKNYSFQEISAKLKIHPFVAKKSVEQGRSFSLVGLKEIYKRLCDIDADSKIGKIDIELALDKFISSM